MIKVDVRFGDLEGALRDFSVMVDKSGILSEAMARMEYVKPSKKRRLAKYRRLKTIHKANEERAERRRDAVATAVSGKERP